MRGLFVRRADPQHSNDILSDPIQSAEVAAAVNEAVKTLKLGKSAGPDMLLFEHIGYGGPILVEWLTKIYSD